MTGAGNGRIWDPLPGCVRSKSVRGNGRFAVVLLSETADGDRLETAVFTAATFNQSWIMNGAGNGRIVVRLVPEKTGQE